jgi:ATP phosphoribosyltransferase
MRTRFKGCDDALLELARKQFGIATPFGGPTSSGMLTLHCPPDQVFALADFLREKGAQAISVSGIDYVFTQDNPLFEKLKTGL